jgi:CRISPR system Cascade subunit CasE
MAPLYLSRLLLNPRDRAVQRDLADCGALHRRVMSLFPDDLVGDNARAQLCVLYRLDGMGRTGEFALLVQARVAPDWSNLPGPRYLRETSGRPLNPDCKRVDDRYAALRAGAVLAFRLRANPTRKIETKSGPDGERRHGRRVELVREEEQLAWLSRKGEQAGFRVLVARGQPERALGDKQRGWQPAASGGATEPSRCLTFAAVLYEGLLRVTDGDLFRQTLEQGIGPGRAYGFGLLSVAPAGT